MSIYVSDINEDGEKGFWKLNKALYWLKQSGCEWFKTLEKIPAIIGLRQYVGDEGTYTNTDRTIILGTHVDDLVGIEPNEATLDVVQHEAHKTPRNGTKMVLKLLCHNRHL